MGNTVVKELEETKLGTDLTLHGDDGAFMTPPDDKQASRWPKYAWITTSRMILT